MTEKLSLDAKDFPNFTMLEGKTSYNYGINTHSRRNSRQFRVSIVVGAGLEFVGKKIFVNILRGVIRIQ